MRTKKIRILLTLVGADTSPSVVEVIDDLLSFIPTEYLDKFRDYVLKNYDKYRKPIVNIAAASQEFKKRLAIQLIRNDGARFQTVSEVKDFLLEFFVGQDIANCVDGLFEDCVTISLTEDKELYDKYYEERLRCDYVDAFFKWCFANQKRIGDVR